MHLVRNPAASVLLAVYLVSCAGHEGATHGPVSDGTLKRLEANTMSMAELQKAVREGTLSTRLGPPAVDEIRVPMRTDGHQVEVTCGINGQGNSTLVFDTGASRSLLDARTALKHNVRLIRESDASVKIQGVIGQEMARVGVVAPLEIGAWRLDSYPVLVRTQQNSVTSGFGSRPLDTNLLGFDLAQRLCSYVTIDYPRREIVFGFRKAFVPPAGGRTDHAPFVIKHGTPWITLTCGGHSWEALVDTGSFNGIEITREIATRLNVHNSGKPVQNLTLMAVGGAARSEDIGMRTVVLPKLNMFGTDYTHSQVDVSHGMPRVGCFFLKDYTVTFDMQRKVIWLQW